MIEVATDALSIIATPGLLGWMLLGTLIGLVVGIIPGLGGTVGMSLVLPFIFGMDPFSGLALLMGLAAVIHTGDTFPSVLLGVPGSAGSQATIMDGYPLARRGEAGRALGAAFFVSMIGGVVGAAILFAILPVVRPLVLALASPELFMLAVLGLSMVGVLSQGAPVAGVTSGVLGLFVGMIGAAPGAAAYRYTGGELYLNDGLPIAVVALGLFALPEIMDLVRENSSIARGGKLGGGVLVGVRDALRNKFLIIRSASLGAALGMIPGVGGAVVDWIVYGVTKQTSRNSHEFGTGDIRGVIGPESANNAKEGGALVPTLLFGIPGSGTTAVLMGALILLGYQVGPRMVTTDLDATMVIIWSLALANIFGALACLAATGIVAKLTTIPGRLLMPFLVVVMVLASYQSTRHWGDIIAFAVIGLVGWVMKELSWPRVPVLIGFVLAGPAERYLHLSMSRYGTDWLTRPLVLAIGLLCFLIIVSGTVSHTRTKARGRTSSEGAKEAR